MPGIVTKDQPYAVLSHKQKLYQKIKSRFKLISIILIAMLTIWLILTFVLGFTIVNGISMNPTLKSGDLLLIWKLPKTWSEITHSQFIPKRGSIVVVNNTNNTGEQLVKRVIGLPSETVTVGSGEVTVFSTKNPNGLHPDTAPYSKQLMPTAGAFSGQVGVGQIFVMGDNRSAGGSVDSRSSLGNIPYNYIDGQVVMRLFPFDKLKLF